MIELAGLTKRFGSKTAVDDLSFQVRPGVVTGFLGPNGAGKSTTMRMMLDLDNPTSGTVRIDGRHYRDLDEPLKYIGALLDAKSMHGAAARTTTCCAWRSRTGSRAPGRGGAGHGRSDGRGEEEVEGVLARHGPAPRNRLRTARRPRDPDVRRTRQWSGPRGNSLDPQSHESPRGGGQNDLRLVSPDERNGADGGSFDRHRPGPTARRYIDGGFHSAEFAEFRTAALTAMGTPARCAGAGRGSP